MSAVYDQLLMCPSGMWMFEQSGKQLAGLWLTFFADQPLVSLMNCRVSEWLITPFLQGPVVRVGGLFVEQSAGQSFSLSCVFIFCLDSLPRWKKEVFPRLSVVSGLTVQDHKTFFLEGTLFAVQK